MKQWIEVGGRVFKSQFIFSHTFMLQLFIVYSNWQKVVQAQNNYTLIVNDYYNIQEQNYSRYYIEGTCQKCAEKTD